MYEIKGEPVSREMRNLLGRYQRPLPEYALAVEYAAATARVSPEERKRRQDELQRKLKEGVARIQRSDEFRNYLIAMSMFHSYSWHNQLLIMLQRPNATLVRGFNGWKELGRWVKKNETGIAILAPRGPTGETQWVRAVNGVTWVIRRSNGQWGVFRNSQPERTFKTARLAAKWLRDQGATPRKRVIDAHSFTDVYVYDITQTEGKPLPEFQVPTLTGEMNQELFNKMLNLMEKRGVSVSFEARPHLSPETKGQFMHPNQIWVKPDEPPAQQLKTLLHEAAHYYSVGPFGIPRADGETIAESAAFVVGAHHGFDSGVRSFPYVALWAKDEKTMDKNMDAIHKVAEHMIDELEDIAVRPPLRPVEPRPEPRPEPSPAMTVEQMEITYTSEKIKEMARQKGVSTAGSKRDIIKRLIE